jgi:hypothetical protein
MCEPIALLVELADIAKAIQLHLTDMHNDASVMLF